MEIEQATDGAVSRKDLRPDDWQRIWPELITKAPVKYNRRKTDKHQPNSKSN